ncbi:MAG: hypothetical protein A2418_00505 [Candidatus Brennerbacteria bacterium RIFOXYC1_FULL_41_11]|uniref:Nucleotidyltransferase family protein n=1 Tax=Candidatus Brennerbacteria bacterium RIFOXYD1_FULL_41_16 TaxID=1797529 RepID=A0A1G1XL54_9BACT|nr:MAG: hypothetical protein A2391_01965 [Candidatus Brennerbacteria bacterium RIFOXYB1_FULL_41_13]OGY39716.1 MAG: hypothetical protein A2418_00505 [Candidatus Brennerbacteria bacterium RIFOXYC1_FULL_41_11]OGY40340.1 MAG: hypothetical protein A2570_03630 [Candidatus Brennerbacteria bacterium RIFOXYD1_FULL_41_16]
MVNSKKAFELFLKVSKILNKNKITPCLYGSLLCYKIAGFPKSVGDIDFIIPKQFLQKRFNFFKDLIEKFGYKQDPNHIHEFAKDKKTLSFESFENIEKISKRKIKKKKFEARNNYYYLISVRDLLQIYKMGLKRKWRKIKYLKKDSEKIAVLEKHLEHDKI